MAEATHLPEATLPPPDRAALKARHLVVFLEYASTLAIYDKAGLLDRELALYRRLIGALGRVTLVTWSRGEDEAYRARLGDIGLVHNSCRLPWPLWMAYLFFAFPRVFPGPCVVKTNQMSGAQHVLKLARRASAPMVARCGYPWSIFYTREYGADDPRTRKALAVERVAFRGAAHVVGSTEEIRRLAVETHGVSPARCSVMPNYVDTDLLKPGPARAPATPPNVLFLGRLEAQKNPIALVEAMAGLDATLSVVGDGGLRAEMAARAAVTGARVRFLGNVPHGELPKVFAAADAFVLPSLFEGHPKALLEAMACGLPVVGADSPGIREVLRDGETGLLCATDAAAIRACLGRVLADRGLASRLGRAARAEIEATCSLDLTVERELRVLSKAIAA
ncbi:MAG: glycosyltransferase family 4 protein [Azospirillum sp.]|nr:glycosyltransferase family 4 protein [Azospirillum sp.]